MSQLFFQWRVRPEGQEDAIHPWIQILSDGLSANTSLKHLTCTIEGNFQVQDFAHLLSALQETPRLEHLAILRHGEHRLSDAEPDYRQTIGGAIERLLSRPGTKFESLLLNIYMGTNIDKVVLDAVCRGLQSNRSMLQHLNITTQNRFTFSDRQPLWNLLFGSDTECNHMLESIVLTPTFLGCIEGQADLERRDPVIMKKSTLKDVSLYGRTLNENLEPFVQTALLRLAKTHPRLESIFSARSKSVTDEIKHWLWFNFAGRSLLFEENSSKTPKSLFPLVLARVNQKRIPGLFTRSEDTNARVDALHSMVRGMLLTPRTAEEIFFRRDPCLPIASRKRQRIE